MSGDHDNDLDVLGRPEESECAAGARRVVSLLGTRAASGCAEGRTVRRWTLRWAWGQTRTWAPSPVMSRTRIVVEGVIAVCSRMIASLSAHVEMNVPMI